MRRFGLQRLVILLISGEICLSSTVFGAGRSSATPEWLIRTWETEDGLPDNSATAMAQTADGYLWFGTFKGLVRFDGINFRVFTPENNPALPDAGIVNVHLDARDRLWVSTLGGLAMLDHGRWQTLEKGGDYVRTFSERANGDLLLTSFHGGVLEFCDGKLRRLPDPPGEKGRGYLGHV